MDKAKLMALIAEAVDEVQAREDRQTLSQAAEALLFRELTKGPVVLTKAEVDAYFDVKPNVGVQIDIVDGGVTMRHRTNGN